MKKTVCFMLPLIMLTLVSVPSFAGFKITPSISIHEKYNDNIFLESSDEEDDFITTLSPNIDLEYSPGGKLDLSLNYGFHFRYYSRHSDLNDTSIKDTQEVALISQYRPVNRLYIDVRDYYERVPIDVRRKTAPGNDFENMTESNRFFISPYIDVPLTSTISARSGYRYQNFWYDADGNNADNHTAFISIDKRFPFGLDVAINYEYLAYRPEITDDSDIHKVFVEASYQAGPNLRLWVEGGKSYVDFRNNSNEDGSIWSVGSEYNLNILGGTTLYARYRESLLPYDVNDSEGSEPYVVSGDTSTTTGLSKNKRFDLFLSAGKDFKVSVNPYYSELEELETGRRDEIYGVDTSLSWRMTSKSDLSIDGSGATQEFSPMDEEVQIYIIGSKIDYRFSQNLTASIGYRYMTRDSDVNNDDYDNNIAWLQAKMTF